MLAVYIFLSKLPIPSQMSNGLFSLKVVKSQLKSLSSSKGKAQSNVIKEPFPMLHRTTYSRYLELKKSIFASSLLDSVRSSDLSCPSLEFKTNNDILRKLLMLVKHTEVQ